MNILLKVVLEFEKITHKSSKELRYLVNKHSINQNYWGPERLRIERKYLRVYNYNFRNI